MTFRSLLAPYKAATATAIVLIFLANFIALFFPWGIKIVIDQVLVEKNALALQGIAIGLLVIALLRAFLNYARKVVASRLGEKIVASLRTRIFAHVQSMTLADFKELSPSGLLTRIVADVDSVRQFVFTDALTSIYSAVSVVFIFGILLCMNLKLTLWATMALPFFVLTYVRMLPALQSQYDLSKKAASRMMSRVNEVFRGIPTLRALTAETFEQKIFLDQQMKVLEYNQHVHAINAGLWSLVEFFSSFGVIMVLWLGGQAVIQRQMSPGALVAFYSYVAMLFAPIIHLVVLNNSYQEARVALQRINEVLKINNALPQPNPPVFLNPLQGHIQFKNVGFGYQPDQLVLRALNLTIVPGQTVGIVGESGVGKTTLINLVLRFYDPTAGEIMVDGISLRQLDLKHYRQQLAVVLQDEFLFSGTVQENIAYGLERVSSRDVQNAARLALAEDFILKLEGQYQANIGEQGVKLSSGQRQRLALARAILRRPQVLILDEATSALDALTENLVQKNIKQFMMGKTLIIIAHRFSSVMEADNIFVLQQGQVVEAGSHADLLRQQGPYSRLYFEQFKDDGLILGS